MNPYGHRFSASGLYFLHIAHCRRCILQLQCEVKFYPCIVNLAAAYHYKIGFIVMQPSVRVWLNITICVHCEGYTDCNIQLYADTWYTQYTDCNIQLYMDTWSVSSHQYSWLLAHAHLLCIAAPHT